MSSATRSRSRSISAKTAAAQHDGINLYAPPPISEHYNQMIESGRERATRFFENPMRAENVRNDVSYMSVVTQGNSELDKFRLTAQSSKGFTTEEQKKIQSFAGKVPFEHGATARTLIVYVPHSQYDSRILGFELAPKEACVLILMVLTLVGLGLQFFGLVLQGVNYFTWMTPQEWRMMHHPSQ